MTTRLPDLAADLAAGLLTMDEFLHQVCMAAAGQLDCNRASVWRFEGAGASRALRCLALHDEHPAPNLVGSVLTRAQLADYFAALDAQGVFESADTFDDPRLAALRDSYLRPLNIRAALDVAFALQGEAIGVLCCEQVGQARRWRPDDVAAVRAMGSTLGQALASTSPADWQVTQPAPLGVA